MRYGSGIYHHFGFQNPSYESRKGFLLIEFSCPLIFKGRIRLYQDESLSFIVCINALGKDSKPRIFERMMVGLVSE